MSRKIEAIVEELQAARRAAATNLEEIPFAIRPGIAMQVRAAADKVEPLRRELLAATVPSRLFAIFAGTPLPALLCKPPKTSNLIFLPHG